MDGTRIERSAAAWVEAWERGSAHPAVIAAALRALAARATDPRTRAAVARGQRRLAAVPYAGVWALAE